MRTLPGLVAAALVLMPSDMQAQVVFREGRLQGLTPDLSTPSLLPAAVSNADQPDLLHISTGTRRLAALDNLTSGPLTMRNAQERGCRGPDPNRCRNRIGQWQRNLRVYSE